MRLYALKKPDGTFNHQHIAREAGWVWDMAATFARILGEKVTKEEFQAAAEKAGYAVVPVNIIEVAIHPDEVEEFHCQRCGVDINELDVKDNRGLCSECYDRWCDSQAAAEVTP
jgi:hypothetical protein